MPGYVRAIAFMAAPVVGLGTLGLLLDDGRVGGDSIRGTLITAAVVWGVAAPPFIAFKRARLHARVPRIALDEAIGGYTVIVIATTLIVFIFIALAKIA